MAIAEKFELHLPEAHLLHALLDRSPVPTCIVTRGKIRYVNPAAATALEGTTEQIIGNSLARFIAKDLPNNFPRALRGQQPNCKVTSLAGRTFPACLTSWEVSLGRLPALEITFQDLSPLVEAREYSERLSGIAREVGAVFNNSSIGMAVSDPKQNVLRMVNPAFARMHGYEPEEMIGLDEHRLYPAREWAKVREAWKKAETTGHVTIESERLRQDESVFWGSMDVVNVEGAFQVLTLQDISDRKASEIALREQTQLIEVAQAAANAGIFRWDLESGRKYVSPDSYRLFEVEPRAAILAEDLHGNVPEEDRVRVAEAIRRSMTTGEYYAEFRVRKRDGGIRWIAAKARLVRDPVSGPYLIGLNIDVTEKKQAEEALLKSERIAAVGRIASSIAHEINNPLEAVTNLLYLAETAKELPESRQYQQKAQQELRRVTEIVTHTLRFHRQTSRQHPTRMHEIFDSVFMLHQAKLTRAHIQLETRYRTEKPILCYEGEIRQVAANLIGNAVDAMPEGGTLYVRVHPAHDQSGREGVRIAVADTGTGMSPRTLQHLFEPFFTTKGTLGTGLGLWVSHEIIRKHQGKVRVRSCQRPGHSGTVFQVFLPVEPAL
jgi:PAS domain S-box-containing protein